MNKILILLRITGTLLGAVMILLGGILVLSAFHPEAIEQGKRIPRLVVGAIPAVGGLVLLVLAWWPWQKKFGKPGETRIEERVQGVAGELSLQAMKCPHCGGQVDPASAKLNPEGTLSVECGYCQGSFLIQEEPKW